MRGMFTSFGLAFAVGLGAEAVAASSVPATTIMTYDRAIFDGAVAAMPTTIVEDFETFATGETTGGLATAVGVFDTLGPAGSGGTVTGTAGNSGTGLYVRDRGVYGRSNTTAAGRTYLDSNDTYGLGWTIAGLGPFDHLIFTMTDVADSGATFTLWANGTQVGPSIGNQGNRAINMVMLSFGTAIDSLTLELRHSRLNDGFSIDDAVIGLRNTGSQVPAVPLPPAVALLASGMAALVWMRRRRA